MSFNSETPSTGGDVRQDPSMNRANSGANSSSTGEDYPPQLHTGKVGYGPGFGQGADMGEKITGLKEEVIGKVKHDPELVQHGHNRRTGLLKRQEREEADKEAFPDSEENVDVGGASPMNQETYDNNRAKAVQPGDEVHDRDAEARENVKMV